MNGKNFMQAIKVQTEKDNSFIDNIFTEEECDLICKYRYWRKYSGASATSRPEIEKGRELYNSLTEKVIDKKIANNMFC